MFDFTAVIPHLPQLLLGLAPLVKLAQQASEHQPRLDPLGSAAHHGLKQRPGLALLGKPSTQDALASKIRHVLAYQSRAPLPTLAAPNPSPPH